MASKSSRRRRKERRAQGIAPAQPSEKAASRAPARPRADSDEPPPAPWGSFPLVELAVLVGLIMLVLGFFFVSGSRGPILIATGLALGSIGGLELSIREHFAGYRSHTVLLAGVPALIVLGVLFYLAPDGIPPLARAGIGIAVFAAFAAIFVRVFTRRSGGLRYRFGRLKPPGTR